MVSGLKLMLQGAATCDPFQALERLIKLWLFLTALHHELMIIDDLHFEPRPSHPKEEVEEANFRILLFWSSSIS